MSKYIKLFNDSASYEAWKNSEEYLLPNVSYTEDGNLYYNANVTPASPNIVAVYNVMDTSQEVRLCSEYVYCFDTLIIDGDEKEFDQYYKFDTTGLHTVEFVMDESARQWIEDDNGNRYPGTLFNGCLEIISVELPNLPYNIDGCIIDCDQMNMSSYQFDITITCHSLIAPKLNKVIWHRNNTTGVLKYPKGSDYSSWIETLPEGWTAVEF